MIHVKSAIEIVSMRNACRLAAEVLKETGKNVQIGITTKELENIANKKIKSLGAKSAFFGYRDYPGIICTSVNEVIIHGIPSYRKLNDGDIIGIDVGVVYEGFCGDTAKTFAVGKISENTEKFLKISELSLNKALDNCFAGQRIGDVSSVIQKTAEENGFSVVRDFVGHGIGRNLHEDPQIPNRGKAGIGVRIPESCCLAIEVMINEGTWQVELLSDNWTVITADKKLSAHFEHTVLVKKGGVEILTVC
ncbi:MAG: type I methionyl aminopeptidase [Elusimicrobia bacterium RIFOXYC2_FULL_34_12]|nr:MAG: type I methionyl aminopeptidase [Elusimicrobia bacterium RIFOXYC2_FULL_34_12]OGS38569.1 MAG: type I methionyl aminopeptidase [Elusimicrobia bacterium RIFOXYD2_FULL_34_30]HAM38837.1 type I methionyl aminopeptidase [Elusimicrobiota bacterium]